MHDKYGLVFQPVLWISWLIYSYKLRIDHLASSSIYYRSFFHPILNMRGVELIDAIPSALFGHIAFPRHIVVISYRYEFCIAHIDVQSRTPTKMRTIPALHSFNHLSSGPDLTSYCLKRQSFGHLNVIIPSDSLTVILATIQGKEHTCFFILSPLSLLLTFWYDGQEPMCSTSF